MTIDKALQIVREPGSAFTIEAGRVLAAEVERLEAIVDKLSKTADGVLIVPEMRVWGYHHIDGLIEGTVQFNLSIIGEFNGYGWPILEAKDCYSTHEAAERQKGKP